MIHLHIRRGFKVFTWGVLFSALAACGPIEKSQINNDAELRSMTKIIPEKIHLIPDNYHLKHVGRLSDGNMYWIDVQLDSDKTTRDTRDFVCLYIFDKDGDLISHNITDLGFRSAPLTTASDVILQAMASLPSPTPQDIWVRPFSVEDFDLKFGLVVRDEAEEPVVDALPGWTIMFFAPWSEGGYDT